MSAKVLKPKNLLPSSDKAKKDAVFEEVPSLIESAKIHTLPANERITAFINKELRDIGGLLSPGNDEDSIRSGLDEELTHVFPSAKELTQQMTLESRFKDVTFETLNEQDFMEALKNAFPRINWNKAYSEFKAAGETSH